MLGPCRQTEASPALRLMNPAGTVVPRNPGCEGGRDASVLHHQPFTAPPTSPLVSRPCTMRKKTMTGIATSVDAAITWPQSVSRIALAWRKPRSHSGSVRACSSVMMTSATVNSFHAWRNAYTAEATSPGASRGKVMRRNACVRDNPSTMAASSRSAGTPATNPRSIQTVNGTTAAV